MVPPFFPDRLAYASTGLERMRTEPLNLQTWRPKGSDARRVGIASTRLQLTVCNLIIDGTLESLSVYEHGRIGVSERKNKKTNVSHTIPRPI